jgi:hypothetical protein
MMPTSFPESNLALSAPDGVPDEICGPLSVWSGRRQDGLPCVVSCYKLTADEVEEFARTGRVWVMVLGETMPPISVLAVTPFIQGQSDG